METDPDRGLHQHNGASLPIRNFLLRRAGHHLARWPLTLTATLLVLSMAGCGEGGPTTLADEALNAELLVSANMVDLEIQTLVVTVTAPDILTPLVFNLEADANGNASGTLKVPAGDARLFTVEAFDLAGAVTHEGWAEVNVSKGQNPPVRINLKPKDGKVPIEVTLADNIVEVTPATVDLESAETHQMQAEVRDGSPGRRCGQGWDLGRGGDQPGNGSPGPEQRHQLGLFEPTYHWAPGATAPGALFHDPVS